MGYACVCVRAPVCVRACVLACEQAIRCYNGDVSRLADICRQLIVFDSLADIIGCLQEIKADPGVSIVRIKNRLSLDYDTFTTAGCVVDVVESLNPTHR